MNNEKTLAGALCAAEEVADAAQAAPAEGKKKYVPPRMEVIPLGPQRMLATSGEPPVQVFIDSLYGVSYYYQELVSQSGCDVCHERLGRIKNTAGFRIEATGWDVDCGDLGRGFLARYAAAAQGIRDYVDDMTDCSYLIAHPNYQTGSCAPEKVFPIPAYCNYGCGSGLLWTPGLVPSVSFSGANWDVQDFFANARFDCDDGKSFSGTYNGRRFEGTIGEYEVVGD